ncbi:unnamed protein product [Oppiella nova]|uniref:Aminopeptidase N n=1 Tax=Oppiella nova TaxID=334625 RepID=A0A7R9MJD9_9ACAR|nr:unnamed protein product [Oppiella nova]CAG2177315.1 unnamed protein product [Oppiella nova]
MSDPWHDFRLDPHVRPLQYSLTLRIDTKNNVFNGSVEMEVIAHKEVDYFVVHCGDNLTITDTRVYINGTGDQLSIKQFLHYKPFEYFVIQLANKSASKTYRLSFDFTSKIEINTNIGLYKASQSIGNTTTGVITTQFEPTRARNVFPCFDEPVFKSQFDLTLIHESVMNTTLTNMPTIDIHADTPASGWTTTTYKRTDPMSTYLLAIIVSDYVCHNASAQGHDYDIKVCSNHEVVSKLGYATQIAAKPLTMYEEYLGVKYSLPKLDLVAIPNFAGGMENWGLVITNEKSLLWTPDEYTSAN